MIFYTESGSAYEIIGNEVRRLNPDDPKRADGAWVTLHHHTPIEIGKRVTLTMDSLTEYGPDDFGTVTADPITTRTTTPVTGIEVTL